jgi:hypothetical protein
MNRRSNRPPRFSRPLLLLAAALLFAPLACREDDDPERRRDFHAHRTLWQTLELDDYDFVLRRACFCPPALSYPTRVEVRDGAVVAATGIESGESVPVDEVPTIDDLFDIIESALEDEWELVDVTYDPERGFPTAATLDPGGGVVDAGVDYEVRDVVAAEAEQGAGR